RVCVDGWVEYDFGVTIGSRKPPYRLVARLDCRSIPCLCRKTYEIEKTRLRSSFVQCAFSHNPSAPLLQQIARTRRSACYGQEHGVRAVRCPLGSAEATQRKRLPRQTAR